MPCKFEIELSDDVIDRVVHCFALVNEGRVRFKTVEEMLADMIDDIVDVWIDKARKKELFHYK